VAASLTPAAVAPSPEPQSANPLLVAQGAPRPQATMADLPKSLPQAAPQPATQAVPPQPSTPQAALAQMVPEALARQNSLAPLLASLASIAVRSSPLPEPVVRAALQMLAQRIAMPAGGPTADILKAAIAKSGVYLEASLAKSAPPAGDLKAGLVALKGALATFLGGNPAPVTALHQAAPPLRGMPPRAEPIDLPPLPDAPRELARALHGQTDADLSRVKLMQFASLPDADPLRGPGPELRTELPFLIGSELVMAQFQIFRDGRRGKTEGKRGWTMRFAMNFSGTGEVGAEIGLLGRSVTVALWAAEPEIAERLAATLPELSQGLVALGLEAGAVRIRNAPPEPAKPASGHYLDSVS
jgi:hypothetical protein